MLDAEILLHVCWGKKQNLEKGILFPIFSYGVQGILTTEYPWTQCILKNVSL